MSRPALACGGRGGRSVHHLALALVACLLVGIAPACATLAVQETPADWPTRLLGAISLVLGAGLLVDSDVPGRALSLPVVAAVIVAALGCVLIAVRLGLRSRRQAQRSGAEAMVGQAAQVLDWSGQAGHVLLMGERWKATGTESFAPGRPVRVLAVNGLKVAVAADEAAGPPIPLP